MYFILSLVPLFILIFFKSKKSMHMLQQNYYDESKRYFFWIIKNLKKVFLTCDIFLLLSIVCLLLNENVSYIFFARFTAAKAFTSPRRMPVCARVAPE